MAIASEVNAVLDIIGKAAVVLQYIRGGIYKASQEVESFPSKVEALAQKEREMRKILIRYGMADDISIKPKLERLHILLDLQDMAVTRLESSRYFKLRKRLDFDGELSQAIEDLMLAIEAIPQSINTDLKMKEILQKRADSEVQPLFFSKDSKYVPLTETIEAVRNALKTDSTRQVVTLYGRRGDGKSSLAKYLAIQYEGGVRTDPKQPINFVDGVFFLNCGRNAQSKSLLIQLWNDLGYKHLVLETEDESTAPGSGSQQHQRSIMEIKKQLRVKLKSQNILIVIDDVWEHNVVEDLLIGAGGVRYLITTQNKDIWSDSVRIQITKPTFAEARQIIVNYVDGLNGDVPQYLEGALAEVVEKCDFNPWMMANVAIRIRSGMALDLAEWNSVTERYWTESERASSRNRPVLYGSIYGKQTTHVYGIAVSTIEPLFQPPTAPGIFKAWQGLLPGQSARSGDGRFSLTLQTDGDLVLTTGETVVWSTGTYGRETAEAFMQGDGNFVLYSRIRIPVWASGTRNPGATFNIKNDGSLVVYGTDGSSLWNSGTYFH